MSEAKVDKIAGYIETVDDASARKKYKRILKNLFSGQTFTNANTVANEIAYEIGIGSKGIGEIIARQPVSTETLATLEQLNEIVENAKYIASEPTSHQERRGIDRTDLFETETIVGNRPGVAKMRVNVGKDGNKLYFATNKITEGETPQLRADASRQRGVEETPSASDPIIRETASGVNTQSAPELPPVYEVTPVELPVAGYGPSQTAAVRADSSMGAAPIGFDPYTGALNEGESPARIIDVPVSTDGTDRVSRTARTAMEAAATPEAMLGDVADAVMDGRLAYLPITNKDTAARAARTIKDKGFETALRDWTAEARRGYVSADLTALGATLYNAAANSGDTKLAISILTDYAAMVRTGAQAVQAARILKTLTPSGKLYYAQQSVDRLQRELNERYGEGKYDLSIPKELADAYMKATTEEAREAALNDIYRDIAAQIPATWTDKWNAWRYLAMLANPRTHIRNLAGNAAFVPVRMMKDAVAYFIEAGANHVTKGKVGRTKAVMLPVISRLVSKSDRELIKAAYDDVANVQELLLGEGKYSNASSIIEENRRIFALAPVEGLRKLNSKALDAGDAIFSRPAYAGALAGYLKANGVTAEDLARANGQNKTAFPEAAGIVPFSEQEANNLTSARGIVDGQGTSFRNFIDNIKTIGNTVRFYFGKVSNPLGARIAAVTGKDVSGYNIAIRSDEVKHSLSAHGNASYEAGRGHLPVTPEALERLPEIFTNPDEIVLLPKQDYAGRTAFEIKKQLDGYMVAVVGIANGKHSIEIDSVRIINKKGSPTTASATQSASPSLTSKTSSGQTLSLDSSIRESASGVNTQSARTGEEMTALLDKARAYAVREAQKATYRDANALSDFVSKAKIPETGKAKNVAKVFNTMMEGVLPFRRTPANILARGLEYSPLGLVKGLTYDLAKVRKGEMTAAEAIDDIAAGLTGTGLVALGAFLAAQGLITGGGSGDEEKDAHNDLTGGQDYALTIGDRSYTLDWLAPEALPFFVGVELYGLSSGGMEDSGRPINDIITALGSITEPMLEMSMLSGVQDLLDSIEYSDNRLMGVLSTAATSYVTQAFPTLFGQIERVMEGERQTTFVDRTGFLPNDAQYTLGQVFNKLPGPPVEFQQIPYIDAWGRTEDTGTTWEKIVGNMLAPWYSSTENVTPADEELDRLYEAGFEAYPQRISQSEKIMGEYLTAEEYVAYARTVGQTSLDLVSEMIASPEYAAMTDEEKANAVELAYQYARAVGKEEITGGEFEADRYVELAQAAQRELGLSEAEYLLLCQEYGKSAMGTDKLREAYQAGLEVRDYFTYLSALDQLVEEGKSAAQVDAAAALLDIDMENELKGELWQMQNSSWSEEKNPYTGTLYQAGISPETSVKIMEKYREIDNAAYTGDSIPRQKQTAFSQYLDSLGLSDAQRAAVDETYRYWTMFPATPIPYSIETMTDAAQRRWTAAEAWGLTEEEYLRYYPIYSASGEGKTKAAKIAELVAAGMTQAEAEEFWRLMAAS